MSYSWPEIAFGVASLVVILLIAGFEIWISWIRTDLYIRYIDWAFGRRKNYQRDRDRYLQNAIWSLRLGSVFGLIMVIVGVFAILSP
jgi:hypothetical protein